MSAPPTISEHAGVLVVRDDLIPGGTKARILPAMIEAGREYVYASPAYGYAQVALAIVARQIGATATVFVAQRGALHPRTREARDAGARIVQIPYGYLSNVQAKARAYAAEADAELLPFGLDTEPFTAGLAAVARSLPVTPAEVWCVAGSGALTRALQRAWPNAAHHAVIVGAVRDSGTARRWDAPESFERDAKEPPPFASCSNYDAKAWRFIVRHASPGALFWNVAG